MARLISIVFLMLTVCTGLAAGSENSSSDTDERAIINGFMDGFHEAADHADKDRYLKHFTKDGVFMGTDDWERWSLEPDFKAYVSERFKGGTGWSYKAIERHISFSPDRKVAWFDEITKSEKWGLFRGTGVLLKQKNGWKLAHYAMSVLVPNEAWLPVSDLTRAAVARRQQKKK